MASVEPTTTHVGLEYTIVECPRRHYSEVTATFPGVDPKGLLMVLTCQRSDVDLVSVGDAAEAEKDRLLEKFTEFAKTACKLLANQGLWADFIDPCSGLPMVNRESPSPYDEVDGFATVLGYRTSTAGPCKSTAHEPSHGWCTPHQDQEDTHHISPDAERHAARKHTLPHRRCCARRPCPRISMVSRFTALQRHGIHNTTAHNSFKHGFALQHRHSPYGNRLALTSSHITYSWVVASRLPSSRSTTRPMSVSMSWCPWSLYSA